MGRQTARLGDIGKCANCGKRTAVGAHGLYNKYCSLHCQHIVLQKAVLTCKHCGRVVHGRSNVVMHKKRCTFSYPLLGTVEKFNRKLGVGESRCKLCTKIVGPGANALSLHIYNAHKDWSLEEYYLKFIGRRSVCKVCGKPTRFLRITEGFLRLCDKCFISSAHLGGKNNPFYGRHHSHRTKKILSLDHLRNWEFYSKKMRGNKNPNWCGGSSETTSGYLYTYKFFNPRFRGKIREEQSHRCPLCSGECSDFHHIDYNKKNDSRENLIFLCKGCHAMTKVAAHRHWWTEHLRKLNQLIIERRSFLNKGKKILRSREVLYG